MIVVCDTSPLNYLIMIGSAEILPHLFGQLYAPPAVIDELKHSGSPEVVRQWAKSPPGWLTIQQPTRPNLMPRLDPGEVAAICLAEELHADAVLIDEKEGRQVARERGQQVVGTLGVLSRAARLELIDLPRSFERLKSTSFHAQEALFRELLRQDHEFKLTQKREGESGPHLQS